MCRPPASRAHRTPSYSRRLIPGSKSVGRLIEGVKLRAALEEVVALATEANRYLDAQGPWFQIKQDKAAAGQSIYTALRAINSLKTLFAPFLPHTSQKLHEYLGYDGALFGTQRVVTLTDALGAHDALTYDGSGATGRWQPSELRPGQALRPPQPLFRKLDESVANEEKARLGQAV